ncbi:MAG TPA: NADH-quinone oxidoreductase subunit J [Gammaproteobacteria bacterium]|nr:NADH-quinone oxidoreductase subunit J [Gammaproteobacteria bacterium]
MNAAFYLAAAVAAVATLMTITRANAMHALLYLIVSLFAVAVVFYVLGAPFAAVLEVIVYAGAIMVLFVFVIMMLIGGKASAEQERAWLGPRIFLGPSILSAVLLAELAWVLAGAGAGAEPRVVDAPSVAALLFGPDLLAVEIASMLLLAGLVGAFRLGRGLDEPVRERLRADAGRAPSAAERERAERARAERAGHERSVRA